MQWSEIWFFLKTEQRTLNRTLLHYVRGLKQGFSILLFVKLLSISILYGLLHALGPGHGKAVVATHMISKNKKWSSVFKTALVGSLTHVGVATLIAFSFHWFFTGLGIFAKQEVSRQFSYASGALIILVGIVFLSSGLLKKILPSGLLKSVNNDGLIGVIAGIVPCPVTMTILLISLRYSILYVGIAAAIGIGVGLFIALCSVSIFSVYFMKQSRIPISLREKGRSLLTVLPLIQGTIFVIIGVMLLPLT
ncbi:MAG: hypothetical protein KAG61_11435 [Bacteriovoracaceae bacterium]|nr:hypothetical protein [Bacteriovoracaceae bacterium]